MFLKFSQYYDTGKHLCRNLFFNDIVGLACNFIKNETPIQVFSCKFCEVFRNTFFTEHLWRIASEDNIVNRFDVYVLYYLNLQYVILCSKNFITEKYHEDCFSHPCRFSSLRILRLISVNNEELCKIYLRLEPQ